MRCQCIICSELFEKDSEIAALMCGHTFHNHCLSQWLGQSSTCPHCRKRVTRTQVINKLFFDIAEDDNTGDPNKLKNELEDAKLAVKQKEKEKDEKEEQDEEERMTTIMMMMRRRRRRRK